MKPLLNYKSAAWCVGVFSFVVLLLSAWILGRDLSRPLDLIKTLPLIVTADFVVIAVFAQWGWKLPLFKNWLVLTPNLNGTWRGEIRSSWINPETKNKLSPIPSEITIKQSLFCLSCVARTGEMKSFSFAAGFVVDDDHQRRFLVYSYDSEPDALIRLGSPSHRGTAYLEILQNEGDFCLEGEYWTARETSGQMIFNRLSNTIESSNGRSNLKHPMENFRQKLHSDSPHAYTPKKTD